MPDNHCRAATPLANSSTSRRCCETRTLPATRGTFIKSKHQREQKTKAKNLLGPYSFVFCFFFYHKSQNMSLKRWMWLGGLRWKLTAASAGEMKGQGRRSFLLFPLWHFFTSSSVVSFFPSCLFYPRVNRTNPQSHYDKFNTRRYNALQYVMQHNRRLKTLQTQLTASKLKQNSFAPTHPPPSGVCKWCHRPCWCTLHQLQRNSQRHSVRSNINSFTFFFLIAYINERLLCTTGFRWAWG